MNEFVQSSAMFGVVVSLIGYEAGICIQRKTRIQYLNPLLVSIILVLLFLKVCDIDYSSYQNSAKYLSYLLTPATICLAIPMYEKVQLLKKNIGAILGGVFIGTVTSLLLVFGIAIIVPVIILTGIFGNVTAEWVCKVFKIKNPIAKGIAIGTSAHALGTAKAIDGVLKHVWTKYPEFERFTPHCTRHTFATRCVEKKMQPKTLQRLLGHASITTTMDLYCHVTDETLEDALELMERNPTD